MKRKTFHLTLSRKWFDMIASGEKKEEYREISGYWIARMRSPDECETITFSNGYAKNRRQIVIQYLELNHGFGKEAWGAIPNKEYYILKLGIIKSRRNV